MLRPLLSAVLLVCAGLTAPACVTEPLPAVEHIPLRGAHVALTCSACHEGSLDDAPPQVCSGCHSSPQDHYAGACDDCHGEQVWVDLAAPHDDFPLPHNGVEACADCHLPKLAETGFSCTSCHRHREPDAAADHVAVPGFEWDTGRCVYCHPTGQAG